jgi:hypothetical protein
MRQYSKPTATSEASSMATSVGHKVSSSGASMAAMMTATRGTITALASTTPRARGSDSSASTLERLALDTVTAVLEASPPTSPVSGMPRSAPITLVST